MRPPAFLGFSAALLLVSIAGAAGAPNVKGKITGQDKLFPEVYAEAAKPESKRWTWREPSPAVAQNFRALTANPSRDICIAAMSASNQPAGEAIRLTVTGGRVYPTTIVVAPGTQIAFKNSDPFKHRLYAVSQATLKAEDLAANGVRSWSPPGAGKFEIRDELFPSVRSWIVVDSQTVATVFPGKDGNFALTLPAGDYFLKAFFNGKQVGKPVQIAAKEKSTLDMKDPLNVGGEGSDSK